MVLLDTRTPGTSREIYSEDAGGELATHRLSIECSSHFAKQLKSYCCERVELIQLVYYIRKPSALEIQLNSSKAIAGKEFSLSRWCIASVYIYHFSTLFDLSLQVQWF